MPTEKQQMLRGERYDAEDPELVADRRRCRRLTESFNTVAVPDPAGALAILRELLGAVGEDAEVLAPFRCDYGYQIRVGPRTFINYGCTILDSAPVTIGADVQVGPNVQLLTPLHPLDGLERRTRVEWAMPVAIDDGVWLAAGVIVCPGVTIGADAVIGAGSVVTRDMPAGHLCAGNPCRVVRDLR